VHARRNEQKRGAGRQPFGCFTRKVTFWLKCQRPPGCYCCCRRPCCCQIQPRLPSPSHAALPLPVLPCCCRKAGTRLRSRLRSYPLTRPAARHPQRRLRLQGPGAPAGTAPSRPGRPAGVLTGRKTPRPAAQQGKRAGAELRAHLAAEGRGRAGEGAVKPSCHDVEFSAEESGRAGAIAVTRSGLLSRLLEQPSLGCPPAH
jgi:hypothetical protein